MNKEQLALSISNLTVQYHHQTALSQINLNIPQGVLVGILGPNGAGKSTLVKAALGLIKPQCGTIRFFDQPLNSVKGQIGYVPQRESVDWDFPITVRDLVLLGRYGKIGLFRKPKVTDYQIVDRCLQEVDLSEYSDRQIGQLSCGQQQRAFIARAFAQEAQMYFMDEPFSGIDLSTEHMLVDLLKNFSKKQNKTLFVVHHDLNTVQNYFDWVIMLNKKLISVGEVTATYTADNIKSTFSSSSDYV